MTLREAVADRAVELDGVKPGVWFRLVPLQDGEVNMLRCAMCILGHVFRDEAGLGDGYRWAVGEHGGGFRWARDCDGAFNTSDALPFWRDEISARLAAWKPDADSKHAAWTTSADQVVFTPAPIPADVETA